MSGRILAGILCLIMFAAYCHRAAAAASDDPMVRKIGAQPAIMARQQRDHRIAFNPERFGTDRTVHVYTTLADFEAPFSFSLGWFLMVNARDGEACLDEFGERIPMPGAKPERGAFNKIELQEIRGFDSVAAGDLKQALSFFETAARSAPQNAKARNNLGACLAALGQYGRAQKEFDEAIKLKADYALAYANRAWLALLLDQSSLALPDLRRSLEVQGDLKPAVLALLRTYIDSGKLEQARVVADRAFARWPEDTQVCLLAGDAYVAAGDVKSARQRYQKALVFGPNNPRTLLRLAHTAERLGDLDDAISRAKAAVQASPEHAQARLELGRYLEMNRNLRAAQLQYERALELNPATSVRQSVYGPLLRVLINTNKLEEADRLSKRWLAENPESAECRYNRAWVASQLPGPENKAEAVEEYRKAVALNPELVQAHYNLALILISQGKEQEAARELKAFIEKSPKDPDTKAAGELLAKISK
ncbi:MAG TPA: tetratricopeptide repeat protein [Candidatus Obscuribacterales bacterium]